ncbi:MAG: FAD-dependent oxidoreductase [Planctomycetota bacterium]
MSTTPHTLVVGAGIAGMTCAHKLSEAGVRVTVLDKGRRPGGRLSTRVSRQGPVFDQGAQYFTAKSVTFQQQTDAWCNAGVAARWDGPFVDLHAEGDAPTPTRRAAQRIVGLPGMGAIVTHLSETSGVHAGIDGPHFATRIVELRHGPQGWTARDQAGQDHGPFGQVVLAIPAPQAHQLLAEPAPDLAEQLAEAQVAATWTLMLAFARPLELWQPFVGAFVEDPDNELSIAVNNSAKPGRPSVEDVGECWTLHAESAWSEAHVEDSAEAVAATLTAAFSRALGRTLPSPTYVATHRWRYANVVEPLNERWLCDDARSLGVCGDACTAGSHTNIERAWLSGLALAEYLTAEGPR